MGDAWSTVVGPFFSMASSGHAVETIVAWTALGSSGPDYSAQGTVEAYTEPTDRGSGEFFAMGLRGTLAQPSWWAATSFKGPIDIDVRYKLTSRPGETVATMSVPGGQQESASDANNLYVAVPYSMISGLGVMNTSAQVQIAVLTFAFWMRFHVGLPVDLMSKTAPPLSPPGT
jgi:hypothetical protein